VNGTLLHHFNNQFKSFDNATMNSSWPYSASMTFDAAKQSLFEVTVTNNLAFTVNAILNPRLHQIIEITFLNATAGVLGADTWNAVFKKNAFTMPAPGNRRLWSLKFNGTNWITLAGSPDYLI
jgi:hypothetical protein